MAEGESFYQQLAYVMKSGSNIFRQSATRLRTWAASMECAVNEDIIPELSQDLDFSKPDFLTACQTISKRLKITNTWFEQLFKIELVNEDSLRRTDKQFAKREIRISIFGRHNCGKSTLLNAILSSKLLPVSIHNETSAVVYIQHDMGRIHRGLCPGQETHQTLQQGAVECQACPKLLVTKGDKTMEKVGLNEVYAGLHTLNEDIRDTQPPIPGPTEECVHKEGKREMIGPKEQKRRMEQAIGEKEKGNALLKKGQFKLAVDSYTRGMELDPNTAILPANRAKAFIEMKRYEDAEKDCSMALALDNNYIKAHYRRGVARRCLGRIEEARKDFQAVLKLDPKNKPAKSELAKLEKATSQGMCKLLVNVPALKKAPPPPGWEVLLVDTPGFGEANKHIAQVVDDALKSNTAFLYIMAGDSLGDAGDIEYLKQLYETDKEVFSNGRLVIAVTKFDKNVDEEEESLEDLEGKIKSKVARQIEGVFKVSLSEDIIIPVSGKAAFHARCIDEGNPEYMKSQKEVDRFLKDYSSSKGQPSGQNEDPTKQFQSLPVAELATELEKCCGILELEKRLQVMAKKSVHLWTAKVKADYSQYLKIAEEKLKQASKDSTWSVGEEMRLLQRVTEKTDEITALWKSTDGKKSHAYEKLSSAYEEDIEAANPAQKGRDEIPSMVQDFKKKCIRRMDDKDDFFGLTEFQQEIQKFCSEAEEKLENIFDSAFQLQKLHEANVECVAESAADCSTMRNKAERLREILPSVKKALDKPRRPPAFQSQLPLPSSESQPMSMANQSQSSKQHQLTTDPIQVSPKQTHTLSDIQIEKGRSKSEPPSSEASGNEDLSAKDSFTKSLGDYLSAECEQPENESHSSTRKTKWLTLGRRAPNTHTPNSANQPLSDCNQPLSAEESSQHGHSESRKSSADIQQPFSTHEAPVIPPNECHNEPQSLAELKEKTRIPAVKLTMWKRFCRFMESLFAKKESKKSSNSGEKQNTPTSADAQSPLDKEKFEAEIHSLEESLREECGQYFQTIKDKVVKYYFELYRKYTQKWLREFETDFKDDIDEAVKLLKTLKIHIDKQKTTARKLVALELHFDSLHNFLNSELFSKVYTERNVQT